MRTPIRSYLRVAGSTASQSAISAAVLCRMKRGLPRHLKVMFLPGEKCFNRNNLGQLFYLPGCRPA